ncbi:hypothetical protein CYMTET_10137 [Cymbomonas tetramitiformis]|uniref:Uncharacterized protein n=1 Tax=Cymbomonas tetramitiformis TaxID=36881 RepID=A0AAE0LEB2_9CHLO|nr:hypothetical protein CYMTET_10137 [Cymbomonas tetramitiformis]
MWSELSKLADSTDDEENEHDQEDGFAFEGLGASLQSLQSNMRHGVTSLTANLEERTKKLAVADKISGIKSGMKSGIDFMAKNVLTIEPEASSAQSHSAKSPAAGSGEISEADRQDLEGKTDEEESGWNDADLEEISLDSLADPSGDFATPAKLRGNEEGGKADPSLGSKHGASTLLDIPITAEAPVAKASIARGRSSGTKDASGLEAQVTKLKRQLSSAQKKAARADETIKTLTEENGKLMAAGPGEAATEAPKMPDLAAVEERARQLELSLERESERAKHAELELEKKEADIEAKIEKVKAQARQKMKAATEGKKTAEEGLEEAKEKIRQLEASLAQAPAPPSGAEEEAKQLAAELASCTERAHSAEAALGAAKMESEQMSEQLAQQAAEQRSARERLEEEAALAARRAEAAKSELAALKSADAAAEKGSAAAVEAMQAEVAALKAQLAESQTSMAQLRSQGGQLAEAAQEETKELQAALEEAQRQQRALEEAAAEAQARQAEAAARAEENCQRLEAMAAERGNVEALQAEVALLKEQLAAESAASKGEPQEVENGAANGAEKEGDADAAMQQEVQELKVALEEARGRQRDLEAAGKRAQLEHAELKEKARKKLHALKEVEAAHGLVVTEAAALRAEVADLQVRCGGPRGAPSRTEQQAARWRVEVEAAQQEVQELKVALEEARGRQRDLEAAGKRAQLEHAELKEKARKKLHALKEELSHAQDSNTATVDASAEVKAMRKKMKDAQQTCEEATMRSEKAEAAREAAEEESQTRSRRFVHVQAAFKTEKAELVARLETLERGATSLQKRTTAAEAAALELEEAALQADEERERAVEAEALAQERLEEVEMDLRETRERHSAAMTKLAVAEAQLCLRPAFAPLAGVPAAASTQTEEHLLSAASEAPAAPETAAAVQRSGHLAEAAMVLRGVLREEDAISQAGQEQPLEVEVVSLAQRVATELEAAVLRVSLGHHSRSSVDRFMAGAPLLSEGCSGLSALRRLELYFTLPNCSPLVDGELKRASTSRCMLRGALLLADGPWSPYAVRRGRMCGARVFVDGGGEVLKHRGVAVTGCAWQTERAEAHVVNGEGSVHRDDQVAHLQQQLSEATRQNGELKRTLADAVAASTDPDVAAAMAAATAAAKAKISSSTTQKMAPPAGVMNMFLGCAAPRVGRQLSDLTPPTGLSLAACTAPRAGRGRGPTTEELAESGKLPESTLEANAPQKSSGNNAAESKE